MLRSPLAAVLALALALASPAYSAPEVLDRIVAVVNDGVVLQSELDRSMRTTSAQLTQRGINAPPDGVLRSQVLDRLVNARLIYQRATEAGVRIDDRELNEVITNIAKQNGMTLAQFAESVRGSGMDFLAVRDQIRDEVLSARVKQKEVDSRMAVTEQDVDLYLANQTGSDDGEYRLSHILIAIPEAATPQQREAAKAKITKLAERLKKGEDFGQLAAAESAGAQALKGGDLDFKHSSELPAAFAQIAPKLSKGQVSEVIETASGYHLIKLTDKRGGDEETSSVAESHAKHILLMPNAIRDEDATLAASRDLYKRIQAGEKLETLAKEFSDDPGSKNNGGDLGFQAAGTFVPEFQIRIDQLKIGEVSAPFHTQFGWHIVRVDERRTRDLSQESRRSKARAAIGTRKAAEEYEVWMRRLRDEAYVEVRKTDKADQSDTAG